jgi:RES domain-containing protein
MRLWRLASARRARDFDGGYGLLYDGRWNTRGRAVTYCATVPSLAALEKRVHATDAALLPPQVMVEYDAPDDLPRGTIPFDDLPPDWPAQETSTLALGNRWLDGMSQALLIVPSVIVPLPHADDRNVLINHRHRDVARVRLVAATPFSLDPRLFRT